jgi:hypothetical protein
LGIIAILHKKGSGIKPGTVHPRCLEYIVVHELTHLLERGHGEKFVALMDQFLPDWRARRDELNEAPLGHEEWDEDARTV